MYEKRIAKINKKKRGGGGNVGHDPMYLTNNVILYKQNLFKSYLSFNISSIYFRESIAVQQSEYVIWRRKKTIKTECPVKLQ